MEVLGALDDGAIVAARQGNLLATAFHPELGGDTRLHEYFLTIGAAERPKAGAGRMRYGQVHAAGVA